MVLVAFLVLKIVHILKIKNTMKDNQNKILEEHYSHNVFSDLVKP